MGNTMNKRSALAFFLLIGGMLLWMAALDPQSEPIRKDAKGAGLIFTSPEQLAPAPTTLPVEPLPKSVDLSSNLPPAGDQGGQNSCVGWAVAYAVKSYHERIEENIPYLWEGGLSADRVFSPAFIYNQINNGKNGGVQFGPALNLAKEQGIATWTDMPYDVTDILSQPSQAARLNAARYRIHDWNRINIRYQYEIKNLLHSGYPVIVGALIDDAFEELGPGQTWKSIDLEQFRGHAMVVVGYDDSRQAFKLFNSWGMDWGDNGYCWVDYEFFKTVAKEGYVLMDTANGPKPPQGQAVLTVSSRTHNITMDKMSDLGLGMRFEGSLSLSSGMGQTCRIVIYFYHNIGDGRIGRQVGSLNPSFRDNSGYLVCGTRAQPIPSHRSNTSWEAWIPYGAFDIPRGENVSPPGGQISQSIKTELVAEPLLFVDSFLVAKGERLYFYIDW